MIQREDRRKVVEKISGLLNTKCGPCEIRKELNAKNGSLYARTDGYCNRECSVGQELQVLGKQLIRS